MTTKQKRILIISILASFVVLLDGSVVNVALPTIVRELHGGLAAQQWIVDGYTLTLGALILIAGSLSDIFGRKRILQLGLAGFLVTSVLCALAVNSPMLVVARLLQGMSGALLVPSSLALIMSNFSGKAQAKAIGSWTAWIGIAFIIGPLLGGILVESVSWRGIFVINILPIALTAYLLRRIAPDKPAGDVTVDIPGAVLCALGLGLPVYALIEQPSHGWGDPRIAPVFVVGLAFLAAFFWWEGRSKTAMLPYSLFSIRNFSAGNLATAAVYGGLSLGIFTLGIYLQQVAGYSALQAGLAQLPTTIVMFFLASRAGALAGTYGPRIFMTIGPLLSAVGYLTILRFNAGANFWTHVFPGIMLFSFGMAATVSPLTSAILGNVERKHSGVASAVNNAVSRIAGLLTIALVGLITGPHLDTAGFHRVLIVTAGLFALGGIISWVGIRNTGQLQPAAQQAATK